MVYNAINPVGRGMSTSDIQKNVSDSPENPGGTGRTSVEITGEKPITKKELEKSVEAINKWLEANSTHLKFQLHEKLNEYYVQVLNNVTNEVVREIPQKKMLDIVAKMYEMNGLLLDEKR